MSEVPANSTPLTRDETAALFLPGYEAVFGEPPDQQRAELLLALVWLENANGASIIQGNWGNLSVKPGDAVTYWRPPWFDLEKVEAMPDSAKKNRLLDVHARMVAGTAPEAFRAFPDQQAGLRAWLELLKRRQPILDAASSGDPVAFAHAIFDTKYCPDPECRDAGPSYAKLQETIRSLGYFKDLKKKRPAQLVAAVVPLEQALSFWFWGLLLRQRTCGSSCHADGVQPRSGEP